MPQVDGSIAEADTTASSRYICASQAIALLRWIHHSLNGIMLSLLACIAGLCLIDVGLFLIDVDEKGGDFDERTSLGY